MDAPYSKLLKVGKRANQVRGLIQKSPLTIVDTVLDVTTGYTIPKIAQNIARKFINPLKDKIAPSLPSIPKAKVRPYTPTPRSERPQTRKKGGQRLMEMSEWTSRNSSGMKFPPT
ncbi:MAG TPA: hypothetical protein EYN93_02375 [Planctomycetaceae bacterium]|nr:hypothetical protein [Planctomycetaceae bacterium]